MELFEHLILGFSVALSFENVAYCFLGVFVGTAIGVLPGVGPLVTIAMLLPITFNLAPIPAMIMLAGIVVNNAIVLVDYINHLRQTGLSKIESIVKAGEVRLRPILMTTSTTVLGLLPMAMGLGDGAEIRTPMAITVVAGLISSTILTLVVIPTVYSLLDRGG